MAINTAPAVSGPIYLGDLSADVKQMEGDCPEDERAWVVVVQAKEKDQRRVDEMSAETRMVFRDNGAEQIQSVNPADVRAVQVHACLKDAGNIYKPDGKTPLFKFDNSGFVGGLSAFKQVYGELHPDVTRAIFLAVLQLNPSWDWRESRKVKCPECTNEFVLNDSVLVPRGEVQTQAQEA